MPSSVCRFADKLKCLKVTTGEHHNHDGTIYVFVNGNKVASSNKVYGKGEVVINKCYDSLDKVQVQNPTKNGWAGSISASSKADGKFIPMTGCSGCKAGSDKAKEAFVVDGDDVGATLGKIACMKGAVCTLRFTPGSDKIQTNNLVCVTVYVYVWQLLCAVPYDIHSAYAW